MDPGHGDGGGISSRVSKFHPPWTFPPLKMGVGGGIKGQRGVGGRPGTKRNREAPSLKNSRIMRETEAEPVKLDVGGKESLLGQEAWGREGSERQNRGGRQTRGQSGWPAGRAWPPKGASRLHSLHPTPHPPRALQLKVFPPRAHLGSRLLSFQWPEMRDQILRESKY